MAEGRRYALTPQLDIEQILVEAQNRWLRPAEICEILRNYKKFRIAPEPPSRPPSGSLFLFDRKVLRYFRKDGHNWRKKKDGKTVKEAHEKLKDGSVDVLHCYYAHGEENESFQRRTYWLLEEAYTHIVLVHYLEVKGGKQNFHRTREIEESAQLSQNNSSKDSPACSNSFNTTSRNQIPSQFTDAGSPNSGQTSEYEDAESDNYGTASTSTSTGYHSLPQNRYQYQYQLQDGTRPVMDFSLFDPSMPLTSIQYGEINPVTPSNSEYNHETGLGSYGLTTLSGGSKNIQSELASWDEVFEQSFNNNSGFTTLTPDESYANSFPLTDFDVFTTDSKSHLQTGTEDVTSWSLLKQPSLDLLKIESDGLKKSDSFSRWASKNLNLEEVVEDLQAKPSSSDLDWSAVGAESVIEGSTISNSENLDADIVSPSLSQEQLFSIIDFSPSWTFIGLATKVLITGTFLKRKEEVDKFSWSCMFGEIEVPAQILSDGTLRCYTPSHKMGRVPFYVTRSNRLACSEIREFEFREPSPNPNPNPNSSPYMEITSPDPSSTINDMHLHIRLEKLLSLGPDELKTQSSGKTVNSELANSIASLLSDDDEWSDLLKLNEGRDRLVEKLMKERLSSWLIQKVSEAEEGEKGPNVLGQEGQGVIHLVSALGYDWAVKPIVTAGVNVNFRDVHGWTALHWAASCGRERTVVALKTLGADPGALSDPTPEFPSGRTPADLASSNGHKGIAGFLAESSLTSHLSTLTLKDSSLSTLPEITTLPSTVETTFSLSNDNSDSNLKDSLSAVRNATQAAARIYQVFRLQSFQRKKLDEYGGDKCPVTEEDTLSLLTVKNANRAGPHDMPLHAAAIRIQNKFRGWKGRKEFLIIRQRIVKIQAHVRGHQVRKRYRKIVWTVGIVEKVILRWRRRGTGLRGFQSKSLTEGPSSQTQIENQDQNKKEDDFDVLKEGRKQTEARLQRALARVKSMVQYPEARDQYKRLMTVVTELKDSKAVEERIMNESEELDNEDLMVGLEQLCEDDTLKPTI